MESSHRGAAAVADADGNVVLAVGDVTKPVFPRSAIKVFQALPLVEQGAADRYGFGDEGLALACASHSGEPGHVAGVERMLAAAGLGSSALRCGAHWPMSQPAAYALAKTGTASALHNNCSGKHAGFLCLACAAGIDHGDYWRPEHPVQRGVRAVLEDFTGAVLAEDRCAIDGCSVPTWAIPLENLARGFAKFATGQGLAPARATAAVRLRHACAQKPWHVAGTGRFCTEIMQIFGRACLCENRCRRRLLRRAAGTGLRRRDQVRRRCGPRGASDHGRDLARFLPMSDAERVALAPFAQPMLRNWNGFEVGAVRVTEPALRRG